MNFEPVVDNTPVVENDYPVNWSSREFEYLKSLDDSIKAKEDNVNNPSHYGQGSIEAIDYIKDFLNPEEYQGYLRGNIAKYLHRWPYKNKTEDLKKAEWYLERLIEHAECEEDKPLPEYHKNKQIKDGKPLMRDTTVRKE